MALLQISLKTEFYEIYFKTKETHLEHSLNKGMCLQKVRNCKYTVDDIVF